MSDDLTTKTTMNVDMTFLKSRRGILKSAELTTLFVAFVCFCVASASTFITATVLEFLITSLLLILYTLKINKRLTFFIWPLVDVFNSVFAAVYFTVLSLMAMTTNRAIGTLVGGIVGVTTVVLLCVDGYTLFKTITFNKPRSTAQQTQDNE